MIKIIGKYNSATIFLEEEQLDDTTRTQIYDMCNNPAYKGNDTIRIMPDCHAGKGSVIGFTMKFGDRIDPRCVGVDIGCGMLAVKLDAKNGDINIPQLDKIIQRDIPMGSNINNRVSEVNKLFYKTYLNVDDDYINKLCKKIDMPAHRFWGSILSTGAGNHFEELNVDKDGYIWIVVHTGSRNLGLKVCNYHTNLMLNRSSECKESLDEALKMEINKIKSQFKGKEIQLEIERVKNLHKAYSNNKKEYLTDKMLQDYLEDMKFCQKYASLNRMMISKCIADLTGFNVIDSIESVHNYIDIENKIIRKGSISAQKDERVVIPLNMRDGSIIAMGKGNTDWNESAPHGAGRIMSRSKAKQEVDMELYKLSMGGIYSTCINKSTIDESPFAYKDKGMIINAIGDTVEIIEVLKPILNIKAGE